MKRFNFIECLAEIKIKIDRGNSIGLWLKNILLLTASLKILFPKITYTGLIFVCLFLLVMLYVVGLVDLKYLKLYQKEQELTTSKYNPHLNKLKLLSKA